MVIELVLINRLSAISCNHDEAAITALFIVTPEFSCVACRNAPTQLVRLLFLVIFEINHS